MSGSDPGAPAGWYPVDGGQQRYWDGVQWTEHIAPMAAPSPPPAPSTPPAPAANPAPAPAPNPGAASGFAGPAGQAQAPFAPSQPGWQQPAWQPQPQPQAPSPFSSPPQGFVGQPAYGGQPMPIDVSSNDRSLATISHLLGLLFGFIGPLIIWLVKKDESPFVSRQAKEALNFQVTLFFYWIASIILLIFLIGFFLIPVLIILQIVLPIVAAVKTNNGIDYRYPLTLRIF